MQKHLPTSIFWALVFFTQIDPFHVNRVDNILHIEYHFKTIIDKTVTVFSYHENVFFVYEL